MKVTDFDLVAAGDTTGGTRGGIGTAYYAAPEQWDSAADADHRADNFSVAMTGVFILYGKDLPSESFRATKAFVEKLKISRAMMKVLLKALASSPDDRFHSAVEFQDALLLANGDKTKPRLKRKKKKAAGSMPSNKKRYAVPLIPNRKRVEAAIERFDREHRNSSQYRNFATNHRYALTWNGKLYPNKFMISLATGVQVAQFSQGPEARERLTSLGFEIVNLRDDSSSRDGGN